MPRLSIPILAIALTSQLLHAQPIRVSESRPVSALTFEPSLSGPAAAASDGHDYLVVSNGRVTRVSSDGSLLDPLGIALPLRAIRLTHVGNHYLVFGCCGPADPSGQRVVAIDSLGRVTSDSPLPSDIGGDTRLASNGRQVLVVSHAVAGNGNTTYLTLTLLDESGQIASRTPLLQLPDTEWRLIDAATDGDGFLLLLRSGEDYLATLRVSASGTAPIPPQRITPLVPNPALASGAGNFLMTWAESDGSPNRRYLPLSAEGTPIGQPSNITVTGGLPICTNCVNPLAIQWSGSAYVVGAIDTSGSIWTTAIDRNAMLLAGPRLISSGPVGSFALASNGVTTLAVTAEKTLRGRLLSGAGEPLNQPVALAYSPTSQTSPQAAFGAGRWLVAWLESSGVHATRVDQDGVPLDEPSLLLPSSESVNASPAVTFDGQDFQVAWLDQDFLHLQAIPSTGSVIRNAYSFPAPAPNPFFFPRVLIASNGQGQTLLTTTNDRTVRLVERDGANKVANVTIEPAAISFTGSAYFVVNDSHAGPCNRIPFQHDVYVTMTRVLPNGSVLDTTPVRVASRTVNSTECFHLFKTFAWGSGTGLLLISDPGRPSALGLDQELRTRWAASLALNSNDSARAAFDGVNFLIVPDQPLQSLVISVVSPEGRTLPVMVLPITNESLTIAGGDRGLSLLLSTRADRRVFLRLIRDSWAGDSRRHATIH